MRGRRYYPPSRSIPSAGLDGQSSGARARALPHRPSSPAVVPTGGVRALPLHPRDFSRQSRAFRRLSVIRYPTGGVMACQAVAAPSTPRCPADHPHMCMQHVLFCGAPAASIPHTPPARLPARLWLEHASRPGGCQRCKARALVSGRARVIMCTPTPPSAAGVAAGAHHRPPCCPWCGSYWRLGISILPCALSSALNCAILASSAAA